MNPVVTWSKVNLVVVDFDVFGVEKAESPDVPEIEMISYPSNVFFVLIFQINNLRMNRLRLPKCNGDKPGGDRGEYVNKFVSEWPEIN